MLKHIVEVTITANWIWGLGKTYWSSQERCDVPIKWKMCLLSELLFTCWGGAGGRVLSKESAKSLACAKRCLVFKEWWSGGGFLCQWNRSCCSLLFSFPWKKTNFFNCHLIKILLIFVGCIKLLSFSPISKITKSLNLFW